MFQLESRVRSYCNNFPTKFSTGLAAHMQNSKGIDYLDFLSACGSLNYGHNHPVLKAALLEYIEQNGLTMSLDLETNSKEAFIEAFSRYILQPRGLDYKFQFTGPTGTNAVEAAIKLARKITGRTNIIAFTNAFHGCSLGSLALTGNKQHRYASSALLNHVTRVPYDGYLGGNLDSVPLLRKLLEDPSSGCDAPAAIIFETIQGEGGLNACSPLWAQHVAQLARAHGALLIIDDIQAGCGRTGDFFSFEALGIVPDIIIMAKSLSGFGLPLSLVLMKPEYDVWHPGEHNGTFRGNNYAFVTATATINTFWQDDTFSNHLKEKIIFLTHSLHQMAQKFGVSTKGRGFMQGVDVGSDDFAKNVQRKCFEKRLIIERCGPYDEVLKILPPLTIDQEQLEAGIQLIEQSISETL